MDRLETWEIPLTPTREQAGNWVASWTLTLARKAPSVLPGARAQAVRHEPRRVVWTPEAKQISDRGCGPEVVAPQYDR